MLDFIGWIGFFVSILAQALVSFGKIKATSLCFSLLSWLAFLGISTISVYRGAYQPAFMSFFFCIVVTIGYIRTYVKERRETTDYRRRVTVANRIKTNTLDEWRNKGILPTRN